MRVGWLRVTWVRHEGAFPVGAPDRGRIATLRVRRKIKGVPATRGKNDTAAWNDAPLTMSRAMIPGVPIDENQIEHLGAGNIGPSLPSPAGRALAICAEQELLAGRPRA
jgi:hypothetical protein